MRERAGNNMKLRLKRRSNLALHIVCQALKEFLKKTPVKALLLKSDMDSLTSFLSIYTYYSSKESNCLILKVLRYYFYLAYPSEVKGPQPPRLSLSHMETSKGVMSPPNQSSRFPLDGLAFLPVLPILSIPFLHLPLGSKTLTDT